MNKGIQARWAALPLGLTLLVAGCGRGKNQTEAADLETIRTELKEQVADGTLTTAEAQVKLAEAFAEAKRRERAEGKTEGAGKLEALGTKLKEQVEKGEISAEEAKAKWIEAIKEAGTKTKGEATTNQAGADAKAAGTMER